MGERRTHEHELLSYYLQRLEAKLAARSHDEGERMPEIPTLDVAFDLYCKGMAWGLVVGWLMCPPQNYGRKSGWLMPSASLPLPRTCKLSISWRPCKRYKLAQ